MSYSDVGGGWPGTGNIDADPLFTSPSTGDYSLSWTNFPFSDNTRSPCIDTGDPTSFPDPDGTPVDMGYKPFDQVTPKLPLITSILDVPNDQGKKVVINWNRSRMDHPDTALITEYAIWRVQDWADNPMEYMGSTPAQFFDEYAFIAPTISDSTSAGIDYYKFMVIALTEISSVFYNSVIDSGYSVDNLAPDIPADFSGYFADEQVSLSWQMNPEEDFSYFALYRSEDPNQFPQLPYVTTVDTSFTDSGITESDTLYYILTAIDFNENESDQATLAVPIDRNVIVMAKVFLEGPFRPEQELMTPRPISEVEQDQPYHTGPWNYAGPETLSFTSEQVIDWLLLEIREASDAATASQQVPLRRKAVLLLADGSLVDEQGHNRIHFEQEITQDLFITLWHKNHLGIQSAFPLVKTENYYSYDFSLNSGQAIGGSLGQKELTTNLWGMIGGDGDHDGFIDLPDLVYWQSLAGNPGYLHPDYNMDGELNNQDKNDVWWINIGKSRQVFLINPWDCGQPFTDGRDDQTYETVLIGDQCWMKENLNYETGTNWCYGNDPANCNTYGRLYDWTTIMDGLSSSNSVPSGVQGICPTSWHIASDAEWCIVTQTIDPTVDCDVVDWSGTDVGTKMKSLTGWSNGSNSSGFTALPGGYLYLGNFYNLGSVTPFWSCTEGDTDNAWARALYDDHVNVRRDDYLKGNGFSVRCVKD